MQKALPAAPNFSRALRGPHLQLQHGHPLSRPFLGMAMSLQLHHPFAIIGSARVVEHTSSNISK
jgi:hypothetical protein